MGSGVIHLTYISFMPSSPTLCTEPLSSDRCVKHTRAWLQLNSAAHVPHHIISVGMFSMPLLKLGFLDSQSVVNRMHEYACKKSNLKSTTRSYRLSTNRLRLQDGYDVTSLIFTSETDHPFPDFVPLLFTHFSLCASRLR